MEAILHFLIVEILELEEGERDMNIPPSEQQLQEQRNLIPPYPQRNIIPPSQQRNIIPPSQQGIIIPPSQRNIFNRIQQMLEQQQPQQEEEEEGIINLY